MKLRVAVELLVRDSAPACNANRTQAFAEHAYAKLQASNERVGCGSGDIGSKRLPHLPGRTRPLRIPSMVKSFMRLNQVGKAAPVNSSIK